jgi:hypothetical protein
MLLEKSKVENLMGIEKNLLTVVEELNVCHHRSCYENVLLFHLAIEYTNVHVE